MDFSSLSFRSLHQIVFVSDFWPKKCYPLPDCDGSHLYLFFLQICKNLFWNWKTFDMTNLSWSKNIEYNPSLNISNKKWTTANYLYYSLKDVLFSKIIFLISLKKSKFRSVSVSFTTWSESRLCLCFRLPGFIPISPAVKAGFQTPNIARLFLVTLQTEINTV